MALPQHKETAMTEKHIPNAPQAIELSMAPRTIIPSQCRTLTRFKQNIRQKQETYLRNSVRIH
jgi:hypothetical protein